MKTHDITRLDISNFLPHREPMLMVSSVLDISSSDVTTRFYIDASCIFVKDGKLTEGGLIENAAQTASAVVGQTFFDQQDTQGTGNKLVGYISAIKNIELKKLPGAGDIIITSAKLLSRFDTGEVTLCSLETETFLDEELIVAATLNFLIHEV